MSKLSKQQSAAIDALFENGFKSKKDALRKAKYSEGTNVEQVFNNPKVKKEIQLRQKALARKHQIEQDHIVDELAHMSFCNPGDLIKVDDEGNAHIDYNKLTDSHRKSIKSFNVKRYKEGKGQNAKTVTETKIEFVSKLTAIKDLSTHLGLFDKDETGAQDLVKALMAAKKRVRIGIQVDGEEDRPQPRIDGDTGEVLR